MGFLDERGFLKSYSVWKRSIRRDCRSCRKECLREAPVFRTNWRNTRSFPSLMWQQSHEWHSIWNIVHKFTTFIWDILRRKICMCTPSMRFLWMWRIIWTPIIWRQRSLRQGWSLMWCRRPVLPPQQELEPIFICARWRWTLWRSMSHRMQMECALQSWTRWLTGNFCGATDRWPISGG